MYIYIISACFMVIVALGFVVIWFSNGCSMTPCQRTNKLICFKATTRKNCSKSKHPKHYICSFNVVFFLGALFQFFQAVVEATYFNVLFFYLMEFKNWNLLSSIKLQASSYAACTIARVITSAMSTFSPAIKMISGNLFFITVGLVVQTVFTHDSDTTLWYSCILVSVGLSCVESSMLAWLTSFQYAPINNNKMLMLLTTSWTLGSVIGPALTGAMLLHYGKSSFDYILLLATLLNVAIFMLMFLIYKCNKINHWDTSDQIVDVADGQASVGIEMTRQERGNNEDSNDTTVSNALSGRRHVVYSFLTDTMYSPYDMSIFSLPIIK